MPSNIDKLRNLNKGDKINIITENKSFQNYRLKSVDKENYKFCNNNDKKEDEIIIKYYSGSDKLGIPTIIGEGNDIKKEVLDIKKLEVL